MDYSTFNLNNFFIKKDSTLPELKYPLTEKVRDMYDLSSEILENVAVTFSMINADSGKYVVANAPANLVINRNRPTYVDELEYTLMFKFNTKQTSKAGRYFGEFSIDILQNDNPNEPCGKLKMPVEGYINITISDTITKTTVI